MKYLCDSRALSADGKLTPLAFALRNHGGMPLWYRALSIGGVDTFYVGNVCDTCAFFFERLSDPSLSGFAGDLSATLERGLPVMQDEVVDRFKLLLPKSDYFAALLKVTPKRVRLRTREDYFAVEDVQFEEEWLRDGPPDIHNPKTDYYRTTTCNGGQIEDELYESYGFEFIIPLAERKRLDPERVDFYKQAFARGERPTAVSLSILDIKTNVSTDRAHWCLSHYLLDGHHKVAAADETESEVSLLSFIALDHGMSAEEHVDRWFKRFS